MQWEQTVYWYALSISIIRQNAAFVKGFFAGKCGYFYAMGFRRNKTAYFLRTFVLFYNAVCTMPQCPYRLPKTAPPPFLPHTINQQKEECICL